MEIHADFNQAVSLDSEAMAWSPSPMAGVDRRMLDRIGGEVARATSIVRYAPNSAFSPHTHSGGEEFLVLDGTFVDEHGSYPKGMYVRNPVGSRHTPSSPDGCVIFVKLWQMDPDDQTFVRQGVEDLVWTTDEKGGVDVADLHRYGGEHVQFVRLLADGASWSVTEPAGAEILVIEGIIMIDDAEHGPGAWLRFPTGRSVTVKGREGAVFWCKTGHLNDVRAPG